MFKAHISKLAEWDIEEIIEWYDNQKQELAFDFLVQLEETISVVENFPKAFAVFFDDLRKVKIKQFPFSIIYFINEKNNRLEIVGVFHEKRNFKYIKKRLGLDD